jgi:hypothetical protein
MNLETALERVIKPELNAIYVEPPFMADGGWDCGWFCREHALHTYILANMLHRRASIKMGDFVLHSERGTGITSINSGADHAWCEINGVMPIDLSMTFSYFKGAFPYLPIVYGAKLSGKFDVRYFLREEDLVNDSGAGSFAISYIERQTIQPAVEELLESPYQFLYQPALGSKKWTEIHGDEIFSKTTVHLFRLAKGQLKPLCRSRSVKQIMKFIKTHYSNATNEVLSAIENQSANR